MLFNAYKVQSDSKKKPLSLFFAVNAQVFICNFLSKRSLVNQLQSDVIRDEKLYTWTPVYYHAISLYTGHMCMVGAGAAFARRWKAQSQNHCGVAARPHWECAVVLECKTSARATSFLLGARGVFLLVLLAFGRPKALCGLGVILVRSWCGQVALIFWLC